jgi:hypothetical protein
MKYLALLIVIFLILVGGEYLYHKNKVVAPSQNEVAASHCGLTIDSPLPGSTVTFPLIIDATIDNTQSAALGCSWGVFEAIGGSVTLKDQSGTTLAQVPLQAGGDWMTTAPTPYSATFATISNPSYTGPLSIIFTEDNAADAPNPDTLTLSVVK